MTVMERLMSYAPTGQMEDWEYPLIQSEIESLQKQGWTDDEIVSKIRWTEHVNPTTDEDVALRNMRMVDERVALRLKGMQ
jgi:hypothetical protein